MKENTKILDTDLSTRSKNLLGAHSVMTVGDLLKIPLSKITNWMNCGPKVALEIQEFMTSFESEKE